ncbi:FAD-dependent monooxygenase [Streptomyces parvulus]|uniref:FAD-dependent monooxygenase n=1 Tax=Streptomyces parvulus TaxID=146923 RepID=UPI00344676BF
MFGPFGGLMVAPLPGGLHRVVGVSPDSLTTRWPGDLSLEELRAKAIAVTGEDFGMRDPVWLSRFGNATRLAAQYRRGRVLLAGDAAHQHFPAGGVGMNVGIQDAHNLGWKLAATLRGWAPDQLLDTYHAERHAVGAQLLRDSRAQTALMTSFTPEGRDLRSLLSRMIATEPALNRALSERLTALAVSHPAPEASSHPLTGARVPDFAFSGSGRGLFARLLPDKYLLLDLTEGVLGHRAGPGLAVSTASVQDPPASWASVRAVLVRPDGHAAWVSSEQDDTRLSLAADREVAATHRAALI